MVRNFPTVSLSATLAFHLELTNRTSSPQSTRTCTTLFNNRIKLTTIRPFHVTWPCATILVHLFITHGNLYGLKVDSCHVGIVTKCMYTVGTRHRTHVSVRLLFPMTTTTGHQHENKQTRLYSNVFLSITGTFKGRYDNLIWMKCNNKYF